MSWMLFRCHSCQVHFKIIVFSFWDFTFCVCLIIFAVSLCRLSAWDKVNYQRDVMPCKPLINHSSFEQNSKTSDGWRVWYRCEYFVGVTRYYINIYIYMVTYGPGFDCCKECAMFDFMFYWLKNNCSQSKMGVVARAWLSFLTLTFTKQNINISRASIANYELESVTLP